MRTFRPLEDLKSINNDDDGYKLNDNETVHSRSVVDGRPSSTIQTALGRAFANRKK